MYGYLAVAALPLYVLHQPIVVAVAYGVVGWQAPIVVKYAADRRRLTRPDRGRVRPAGAAYAGDPVPVRHAG